MSEPDSNPFSQDYATARSRFIEKATKIGAKRFELQLSATGPDNLPLSIDIALIGNPNPTQVLLHCSGIHGVEGFAGSAIQLDLMDKLPTLPDQAAIVFVHVLNPFGMSWIRRVNESNVDLNRNFLAETESYSGVPEAYTALNPMLNPESKPGFDFFLLRTLGSIRKHGYNSLKQAIVGGQYGFQNGLFYGGSKLEEGPSKYKQWLSETLSGAQSVVAVDIHSGLGKYGEDTLLVEGGPGDALYDELHENFGPRVAPWDPEESVAYAIRGGHSSGVSQALPNAKVHFVTQEFGTLAPLKVLHALREENRWHHWGEGHTHHRSKTKILGAFRPNSKKWQTAVLGRGREVALQACRLAFANSDLATSG